jgi:hypothetical protein
MSFARSNVSNHGSVAALREQAGCLEESCGIRVPNQAAGVGTRTVELKHYVDERPKLHCSRLLRKDPVKMNCPLDCRFIDRYGWRKFRELSATILATLATLLSLRSGSLIVDELTSIGTLRIRGYRWSYGSPANAHAASRSLSMWLLPVCAYWRLSRSIL